MLQKNLAHEYAAENLSSFIRCRKNTVHVFPAEKVYVCIQCIKILRLYMMQTKSSAHISCRKFCASIAYTLHKKVTSIYTL